MARPLTDRQAAVLRFVQEYSVESGGTAPTIRDVQSHLGLKAPRAAEKHLQALVSQGSLEHAPTRSRAYRLPRATSATQRAKFLRPGIPLVGRAPAGSPSLQDAEELGDLDPFLNTSPTSQAVAVVGDSMRDAHIVDGDIVIVEPDLNPPDRAIVLATIDGEQTIKTLRRTAREGWWLEPANDQCRPILPRVDGDRVTGRVVAVIRRKVPLRPKAPVD